MVDATIPETVQALRNFESTPESARAVRRFVANALPPDAPVDDVVLIASELASNAIRHARTDYTVRLVTDDRLVRLEVSDESRIIPTLQDLGDSHRGLRIVDQLSEMWGVEPTEEGKTVWANIAMGSGEGDS
jgi:nitrate/nitrite-specific signal transduction histidine kinase